MHNAICQVWISRNLKFTRSKQAVLVKYYSKFLIKL